MSKDIRKHVKECDVCQRTKASNQSSIGELYPLSIPQRPWQSIGMDYLGPVPMSKSGNDMVLIAVDRLTKMAHFIPTTTKVTIKETAELFLRYIFQYHDLPDNIVSDHDPKFTSHFWKNLQKILGIKLLISTVEYSQTDGQSEATIKIVQKLIRPSSRPRRGGRRRPPDSRRDVGATLSGAAVQIMRSRYRLPSGPPELRWSAGCLREPALSEAQGSNRQQRQDTPILAKFCQPPVSTIFRAEPRHGGHCHRRSRPQASRFSRSSAGLGSRSTELARKIKSEKLAG